MPFKKTAQTYSASINTVTLGTGYKTVTVGGNNVDALCSFDAPIEHKPLIGFEITDKGIDTTLPKLAAEFAGCDTVAAQAAHAAQIPGVDFVAIHFESADPNGEDMSVEDCVAMAKEVAAATDAPLCFEGCKNFDKDAKIFEAVSAALEGRNILLLSAREENYKTVAASAGMAYNQKFGAESAVDINLAKQLNVLIGQMGIQPNGYMMNLGTAAVGYGFEYLLSTIDRVRAAALGQNDAQLQVPIITPCAADCWGVKEALTEESEAPEWGAREERGIQMEICTAAAVLGAGSDAVILGHPDSVATISSFVAAMM